MSKTIAFIPARCGSKSIPLKNIKPFCGKPLIYWSLKACVDSKVYDEIIVGTDCDKIHNVVESFGFDSVVVYRRKEENATDTSSTESVIVELISSFGLANEDVFTLIQLTNPFIESTHLIEAADRHASTGKSVISCARMKRFFWTAEGSPINYDPFNRPRRQDFEGIFIENGAFYINTVDSILKHQNRLSDDVEIYEMPEYSYLEIDEEEDWISAEVLMRSKILGIRRSEPSQIKVVFTDVDGVLTDAGMYYSENGDELKKFCTLDGMGFQKLREAGFKTGIITSEDTEIVARRAKKLKIDFLFQGAKDKLTTIEKFCEEQKISIGEIAYMGDDLNCRELLSRVGLAACPLNAVRQVQNIPGICKIPVKGGEGAFRVFSDLILEV